VRAGSLCGEGGSCFGFDETFRRCIKKRQLTGLKQLSKRLCFHQLTLLRFPHKVARKTHPQLRALCVYAHTHTHTLFLPPPPDMVVVQAGPRTVEVAYGEARFTVDIDGEDPLAALRNARSKSKSESKGSSLACYERLHLSVQMPTILKVSEHEHDVGLWADRDCSNTCFADLTLVVVPSEGDQPLDLLDSSTFDLYKLSKGRAHGCPLIVSDDEGLSEFPGQEREELLVAHHMGGATLFACANLALQFLCNLLNNFLLPRSAQTERTSACYDANVLTLKMLDATHRHATHRL
jgi:hypothetical protein